MEEVRRLFDLFDFQLLKYPQPDALAGKYNGAWKKWTTADVVQQTDAIALGLLELGLKPGDMIAIMADTSVEWTLADQAIQKMGGIVVPVYPTSAEKDVAFVLNHSDSKAIFVQNADLLAKVSGVRGQAPALQHIFVFRHAEGAPHYETLIREVTPEGKARLQAIQDAIGPNDLASIIYTSGTTGDPKGVMLSHHNIVSNVLATKNCLPCDNRHRALSFLPLSHIFERMINYMYFYYGISVYYAESLDTIRDNLPEVKPHVFTAVPRLLEKVFDRIQEKGNAATGISKLLFNWAMKVALRWEPDGKNGLWYKIQLKICDIVYKKFRAAVGGNAIAVASGSAALQPRLARFFNAAGIPVVEGYGLTETSPVISVNRFTPHQMKIGAVGLVLDGGTVKIAEDGEILYKGPNLMLGYYKREDLTAQVIDAEGWFHTGDIGIVDEQGFLKITDRKKEIFKTSGGKYIAPQALENVFKESACIEQIVVVGEYKKFPGALIYPAWGMVDAKLSAMGVQFNPADRAAMTRLPQVREIIEAEVKRLNERFGNFERIKKFELLAHEMTVAGGELTPSLKVKRKVVDQKYQDLIQKIYAGDE